MAKPLLDDKPWNILRKSETLYPSDRTLLLIAVCPCEPIHPFERPIRRVPV
jgi:hypothetical protein